MALLKSKTLTNGISGNYWKITSCTIDKQAMTASYKVDLFVSQSFTGTVPIKGTSKYFTFPVTKSQIAGDLIQIGYTNILSQANTVVHAAIAAQAAVAASAPGVKPIVMARSAKAAVPIVYGDNDLQGATDVLESGQSA